jgi:hypothetical protein
MHTAIRCDAPDSTDVWNLAVQSAAADGQGIWRLGVLSGDTVDALILCAKAGDSEAARIVHALPLLLNCLESHAEPGPAAPVCLTCGAAFWRQHCPGIVIVLCAACPEPSSLLISGICCRCWAACGTAANRRTAIFEGLARHYGLVDLRELMPVAQAGHA